MTKPAANRTAAIKRSIGRILGILLFLLFVDGFVYRDPYIKLPHGYGIGSISGSTPCSLEYGHGDERPYSNWTALGDPYGDNDGSPKTIHFLFNRDTNERLEFDNELAFRDAIRELNVRPEQSWFPSVEIIRKFNFRDLIGFGDCENGHFILDIADNDVWIIPDEAAWRSEVERLTGEPPGWLWSANSFLLKHRDPEYLAFMGILTLVCLFMIYRRRNIPIGKRNP